MRNVIAASFGDRARVYRTVYNGVNESESLVYKDIPCGLARSAHTHSPTPVGYDTQTPTKNYRLRLYADPDKTFFLGDRVEVYRGGRVFCGLASDSFYYDSHSVCVLEIGEVREND